MKKTVIILILLLYTITGLDARGRLISGKITDSLSLQPIESAVIELKDSEGRRIDYRISDGEGRFLFEDIVQADFSMNISILGYRPWSRMFHGFNSSADLGAILLCEDVEMLETTVHTEQAIRSSQSGDTLSFNAAAYKTMMGSSSDDMIAKMPGMSVTKGSVEAHGKKVQKIMINGKEYFGEDVITALQNVPADLISEVEVISKLSEEAEQIGVDDGNRMTVLNIVMKNKDSKGTIAAKVYGGYGPVDKYIAGGNANYFSEKQSASVMAMTNDLSRFNFVSNDLVGGEEDENPKGMNVTPYAGLSRVTSAGASYSSEIFTGNYLFSTVNNRNDAFFNRHSPISEGRLQINRSCNNYSAKDYSHKFSSKIKLTPGKGHSIVIRPNFYHFSNDGQSGNFMNIGNIMPEGDTTFIRNGFQNHPVQRKNLRAGGNIYYRYRIDKWRSFIGLSVGANYAEFKMNELNDLYHFNSKSSGYDQDLFGFPVSSDSLNVLFGYPDLSQADSRYLQKKDRLSRSTVGNASVYYNMPLYKRLRLHLEYRINFNHGTEDNKTYIGDGKTGNFTEEPDIRQSAVNSALFLSHSGWVRFNYGIKKTALMFSGGYQYTDYAGQTTMPYQNTSKRGFNDFVYNVNCNVAINKDNTLKIEGKGFTMNPPAFKLQNVVNLNNRNNIRAGNPELTPSYINDMNLHYLHTDKQKGSTISLTVKYSFSNSYVSDSLVFDNPGFQVTEGVLLEEGSQFIKPINLKGYHKADIRFTWGLPLKFISSNLNLNVAGNLSEIPGMINGDYVPIHRNSALLGAKLNSNINENIDFSIGYDGRYVSNEFKGKTGNSRNNFFAHQLTAKVKWIFLQRFFLNTAFQFNQEKNIDNRYNEKMFLWDAFIGMRLFKNRMGEIMVGVDDIFNDSALKYKHNITQTGASDTAYLGLGRYFSIQFIYHFRHIR